jgi:hypothetical protein
MPCSLTVRLHSHLPRPLQLLLLDATALCWLHKQQQFQQYVTTASRALSVRIYATTLQNCLY